MVRVRKAGSCSLALVYLLEPLSRTQRASLPTPRSSVGLIGILRQRYVANTKQTSNIRQVEGREKKSNQHIIRLTDAVNSIVAHTQLS